MTDRQTDVFVSDIGEGPTILFIHPGFTNSRIWEQSRYRLPSGYRSVAIDLAGHGRSPKPPENYTLERFAEDIHTVVTRLDLSDVTFVGWSLSAHIALTYLREFGERIERLALLSTGMFRELSSGIEEDYYLDHSALIHKMETEYPEVLMAITERLAGPNLGEYSKRWIWQMGLQTPVSAAVQILEELRDTDYDSMRQILSPLDIPVAIFHGAHDSAAELDEAREVADDVCAHGRFVGFERSGHFIPLVEPERFDREFLSFLNS